MLVVIATARAVRTQKNLKLLDHLIKAIAMFLLYVLSTLATAIKLKLTKKVNIYIKSIGS